MAEAIRVFGDLSNRELIFTGTVFDPIWNETVNASFLTSFYKTEYRLKFLSQQSGVFKPDMIYKIHVSSIPVKNNHHVVGVKIAVLNGDNSRFRLDSFNGNTAYVRLTTNFDKGESLASVDYPIPDDAIVTHQFIVPDNQANYMSIRVCLFLLFISDLSII